MTVSIKYHPRIAKVLLDQEKVKLIEDYYKKCADDGATEEDIEASKKAMSSMEIILGEPSRLERLAVDIHDHYTAACDEDPGRIQKAMVVCSSRLIAYALLLKRTLCCGFKRFVAEEYALLLMCLLCCGSIRYVAEAYALLWKRTLCRGCKRFVRFILFAV